MGWCNCSFGSNNIRSCIVSLSHSIVIGFISSFIIFYELIKKRNVIDDTVFATHGLGGICGMILTAIFANDVGLIFGKHQTLFLHLIACVIVVLFVCIALYNLQSCRFNLPLRVRDDQEEKGLDISNMEK